MKALKTMKREAAAVFILALAFLAGALNTAGFLKTSQTLSHMTGNLTKLGLSLAGRSSEPAYWFLAFLLCFMLGALLSGLAFPKPVRDQWRRCGLVLFLGGALLFLPLIPGLPEPGTLPVLALVLGAQNGLTLRYRGTLMRTTHVTGHLTDVGAALGRLLHQGSLKGEDLREFLLHLFCLISFFLGAFLCALYAGKTRPGFDPLALCGLLYMLCGFVILGLLQYKRRPV